MSVPEQRSSGSLLSVQQSLSLYLPALVLSLGTGIIAPVLPVYAKSFDVSFGVASLALILYQVGSLAATFPTGYMLDKIGRRPILLTGPVIMALAAFSIAGSTTFPQLLLFRFIGGAAQQMWMQSRLAVIADTAGDRQRGRLITWMAGAGRAGMVLGPAMGGLIAEEWGIRTPFVVYGVLIILVILPSFKLIKETNPSAVRPSAAKDREGPSEWQIVFAHLMTFQMLAFLLAQFLANVARMGVQGGSIVLYAAYAYGVGVRTLGLVSSAAGIFALPIPFATGFIMDRFGRKTVIVPGFFMTGVTAGFLALTARGPWPFQAFVVAYMVSLMAQGSTAGTMQVLGTDLAPAQARGRFFAIWRTIANFAGALGPTLIAVLAEYASYATAFSAVAVLGVSVAFIIGVFLRETVQREPDRTSQG